MMEYNNNDSKWDIIDSIWVSENVGLARSYVNFEMASEDELRLTTVYVEKHKLWLVIAIH